MQHFIAYVLPLYYPQKFFIFTFNVMEQVTKLLVHSELLTDAPKKTRAYSLSLLSCFPIPVLPFLLYFPLRVIALVFLYCLFYFYFTSFRFSLTFSLFFIRIPFFFLNNLLFNTFHYFCIPRRFFVLFSLILFHPFSLLLFFLFSLSLLFFFTLFPFHFNFDLL